MEIKRDIYFDGLINRKHNGFIKIITGIRRSGKSYLLNTLFFNYNKLRFRGFQVDVGSVEFRERDNNGKEIRVQSEIDFIASLGSRKYYIQSAYDILDEEVTLPFKRVKDSFKKIIIVDKSMKPRYDENGYMMIGIKEFLLDPDSLLF